MTSFEQKIANYNNWSIEFTKNVIFEYERFLSIKSNDIDSIPSDKIEEVWKFHILSTENYQNYCNQKFNKFIHYDQTKEFSSEEKLKKIINTLTIYKNMFGIVIYPDVWTLECKFSFLDLDKLSLFFGILNPQTQSIIPQTQSIIPQTQIPDYKSNRPQKDHIKIYIKYQNQYKPGPYNMELIDYKYQMNESFQTLKQIICKNTSYPVKNIKITPHPEILNKNFLNITNGEINHSLHLSLTINYCDFVIVEIYENEIPTNKNLFGICGI